MASFYNLTIGQQTEFHRIISDAGLDSVQVRRVIKNPELAGKMVDALRGASSSAARKPRSTSKFDQFKPHLHSLAKQKATLIAFNAQAPKNIRVPSEWLESLSTSSRHVQSVEDLEIFVVWCGSLEKTWHYAYELMKFVQAGAIGNSGFQTDEAHMRLDPTAFAYAKPGVYRVRINLIDHWSPGKKRSVNQVRALAENSGQKLASIEAVFGYALQARQLIRLQDGVNLPYCDAAGVQCGDGFDQAPDFGRGRLYGRVSFSSWDSANGLVSWSAPSLRGVPRKVA